MRQMQLPNKFLERLSAEYHSPHFFSVTYTSKISREFIVNLLSIYCQFIINIFLKIGRKKDFISQQGDCFRIALSLL